MTRKPGRPELPEEEKTVHIRLPRRTVALLDEMIMADIEAILREERRKGNMRREPTENEIRHMAGKLRRKAIDEWVMREYRTRREAGSA